MPKKIVVHAGIHKTGSTAIQIALFHHPEQFEQQGIKYPRTGLDDGAHHLIARKLRSGEKGTSVLEDLTKEISDWPETVVISSEELDSLSKPHIQHLRDALAGMTTQLQVVIYLRPQYSLIRSQYSQQIREGFIRDPFDVFFRNAVRHARFLKIEEVIDPWIEIFGKACVIVRSAARGDLKGGSSLTDFVNLLGLRNDITESSLGATSMANESLNLAQCDVIRRLSWTARFWELPFDTRRRILVRVFRQCKAIRALHDRQDPLDYRGLAFSRQLFHAENQRLADKYFQGKNVMDRWYAEQIEKTHESGPPDIDAVDWGTIYSAFSCELINAAGMVPTGRTAT